MARQKNFASRGMLGLFALWAGLSITFANAACSGDRACVRWTQAEGACPAQKDALPFFHDQFCSSSIVSVDSEPTFEDGACCYAVTEDNSSFAECGISTGPVPPPGTIAVSAVAVGVGGSGASFPTSSSSSGMGGAGGSGSCSSCKQFLVDSNPPPLCASSTPYYEALTECRCNGACKTACSATACMGLTPSQACETCMLDATNGCGNEYLACSNN